MPKFISEDDIEGAMVQRLEHLDGDVALHGFTRDPVHLRADTATRVSAKPRPRSHLAGLLRSERQLLANPPFNDSDWFRNLTVHA